MKKVKKVPVTLSITKEVIDDFSEYCNKYGMRISKRIEILIKRELENPTYRE